MTQQSKCEYNNEDNSMHALRDKNHQASSKKFRQINSVSLNGLGCLGFMAYQPL